MTKRAARDASPEARRKFGADPFFLIVVLCWPLICAASALLTSSIRRFETFSAAWPLISLHALGGLVGIVSWTIVYRLWISRSRRFVTRFVLSFTALAAFTIIACAGLFALTLWGYFSQWHEPLFSRIGMFQFVGTTVSALYQYAVLGARNLIPVAMPAGLLVAVLAARRPAH